MNRKNLLQTLKGLLLLALLTFGVNRSWAQIVAFSATGTDPVCNGEFSGTITLTPGASNPGINGNYVYDLDTLSGVMSITVWAVSGDTTLSGMQAQTYDVVCKDLNGGTSSAPQQVVLTDPSAISINFNGTLSNL